MIHRCAALIDLLIVSLGKVRITLPRQHRPHSLSRLIQHLDRVHHVHSAAWTLRQREGGDHARGTHRKDMDRHPLLQTIVEQVSRCFR